MKPTHALRNFLFGSVLLAAVTTANAAISTWNGSTSSNWGVGANWSAAPAGTDDALFTSSSTNGYNIHLGSSARTINKITFDSTTGSTPYTIYLANGVGNQDTAPITLSLSGGGITVNAGNHTIMGRKPGIAATGDFILGNNIAFDISPSSSLTLDVKLRSSNTSNNFSKTGAGTLVLNADNGTSNTWNFSNATTGFTVSQGVIQFAATGAYGLTGNKFVVSLGAAIELTSSVNQTINNGTITLNGTGIGSNGALRSVSGSNTITGTGTGGVILGSASSIGVDTGSLTINQAISGAFALTKVGAGTLVLGGSTGSVANTYSAGTILTTGTLQFSKLIAMSATGAVGVGTGTTLAVNAGGTGEFTNATSGNGSIGGLLSGLGGQAGGTVNYTGNVALGIDTTNAGGSLSYGGVIGNVGTTLGLTKLGTGSLVLTDSNTYSGTTTITAGKLTIDSTGTINSTSGVSIGAAEFNYNSSTALTQGVSFSGTGGTLSGSGTINLAVSVTSGNTLAIGNSIGNSVSQMNFGDTLGLAGTDVVEIDGTAGAGLAGGHDFANVTGALTYGGAMTLDMGVVFGAGTYSWNLFDMASETGTFSTISLADQYSGNLLDGDSNGIWDLTSGNNTWSFTQSSGVLALNVIPEPGAALIGSLGLLALLRRRR